MTRYCKRDCVLTRGFKKSINYTKDRMQGTWLVGVPEEIHWELRRHQKSSALCCVVQPLTGPSGLRLHKNNNVTAATMSKVSDVPGMCHQMTSFRFRRLCIIFLLLQPAD